MAVISDGQDNLRLLSQRDMAHSFFLPIKGEQTNHRTHRCFFHGS